MFELLFMNNYPDLPHQKHQTHLKKILNSIPMLYRYSNLRFNAETSLHNENYVHIEIAKIYLFL